MSHWPAFGLTDEQEDRYRDSCLPADLAQARICLWLLLLPIVAFTLNDYGFFGLSWPFYGLTALRLAVAAHTILLLKYLRGLASYQSYDRAEFAWSLVVAVFAIAVAATRPEAFVAHAIVAVVCVFVTVLAIPNRFVYQLAVSLTYATGETLVIAPGAWTLRPGTVTALLSMWLASAIATVCAWQLHCWRRREFFAREAGQKAEADWQQTFNTVPDCVAILDDQHRVVRVNRAMAERLGARAEQCVGLHCYEAVHGTTGPHESCPHAQTCRDHGEHTVEVHEPRLSGDFLVSTTPRFDAHGRFLGAVPVARDVTERKRAEERIRASLAEKEVLLKEIHHRVKNNMQVISSLVALQAEGSHDPAMRAVLQDVTHRVRSMALVHEKLYQSADMARVEFSEYARSLLSYLWRAHGTAASAVRLTLDLEPVPPPVNAAVPCGLILNELVSNALKHAFCGPAPPGRGGEVTVSLRGGPQGRVCLRVRDNGKGLPAGLDWRQANSLGLRLVQMLAGQLHGTLEVSGGEGADFSLTFLEPKPLENQSS